MKLIVRYIAAICCLAGMTCGTVFAEKTVVTAEGKYVMGDLDTKQNAKVLALMEAKRLSLEKAGTYVESLSEVKNYQLTKDQINSLAAGIMSVEILKEDWQVSGESMVVVLSVRAIIDTSNLKSRISAFQENQDSESGKEIKAQLAVLQKELADLKAKQAAVKEKEPPKQEMQKKNVIIINKMSALKNVEEGQAALRVQRYDEAVAAFKKALESDPDQAEAYAGLSIAYGWLKQHDKAVEMVNTALKLDPKSVTGHMAMSRVMFNDGKYDKALESINLAIARYPNSPFYFLHRAETYLKLRNADEALKDFQKACAMKLQRGCQKADALKQRMTARPKRSDAGPQSPGKPEHAAETVSESMKDGNDALQAHRWNDAIAAFQRAMEMDPSSAEPYAGLSIAYCLTQQTAKAKEMSDKALKIDPRSAMGHFAAARILYEEANYDKALESVSKAIDLNPNAPYFYYLRGDIFLKLERNDGAVKNYAQACKMNFQQACRKIDDLRSRLKGKRMR